MKTILIHYEDKEYPDTHLDLRNPENTLRIDIKWDGCVNIDIYCNGDTVDTKPFNEENRDYIHICDLPEFITQLQEALNRAKERGFEMD